jgi:G3E family GTPase
MRPTPSSTPWVQDAVRGTLLRGARRQLHARIAKVLELESPEMMDTQPEVFALHYAEAGLIENSVAFWREAGERSAARSEMAEAEPNFLGEDDHQHDDAITSVALRQEGAIDINKFNGWISALLRMRGQDVLRSKGILNIKGSPERFVFQAVPLRAARAALDPSRKSPEAVIEATTYAHPVGLRFFPSVI